MAKKNQDKEWDNIWKERKTLLNRLVDFGREIYNYFFIRLLRRYVNKDTDMLEFGCGTSTLGLKLSKEIKGYTGADISDNALKISKKNAEIMKIKNAIFLKDDCTNTKINKKYDLVWSQGLIEHFDAPVNVVKQHFKACKKNGFVIVSVPYKYSYLLLWYWITRPKFLRKLWPWTEQDFFTHKSLGNIGKMMNKKYEVKLLQPFFLGVIILTIKKNTR